MKQRTWQYLWFALLALFLYVGIRPSSTPPPPGYGDLIAHAAINLILGAIAYKAFSYPRPFAAALVGLLAFGGIIEVVQSFVPNREPSFADFLADLVGVAIAAGSAHVAAKR